MAIKYVDFGRGGGSYAGTEGDPYSWADFLANLTAQDTYYCRGQVSLASSWSPAVTFTMAAWDVGLYGPWRIYGGTTYDVDATDGRFYDGMIWARHVEVYSAEGMLIRADSDGTYSLEISDGSTIDRSTLYLKDNALLGASGLSADISRSAIFFSSPSTMSWEVGTNGDLTILSSVTNSSGESDFIILGSGATADLDGLQYGYPNPTEVDWFDADLTAFNYAPGYGIGVHEEWAESLAALFSVSNKHGIGETTVQFTDESTGNPQSWLWDFGDGNTSTDQNPSHTYEAVDERTTYEVTLTVTNKVAAAAPSWVDDGNYWTEEDFSGGTIDSTWWNELWQEDIASIQQYGTEYSAVMTTTASFVRLTPPDVTLSGNWELEARINFGPTGGSNKSMHLQLVDSATDTAILDLNWKLSDEIEWEHLVDGGDGAGVKDTDSVSGLPSVNGYIDIRLVKVGNTVTAYYQGENDASETTMTTPFDLSVGGYTTFYLQADGADNYGWEYWHFQSDDPGLEEFFHENEKSKSGFITIGPRLAFPLRGYGYSESRVAYHFGTLQNPQQGYGWSEIQDAAWVWPDSPASLIGLNDPDGYRLAIGNCSRDGLFWLLNTRNGPASSRWVKRWLDKVDPNVEGSGTEIPATIKWPERVGSKQHYTMQHVETHVHLRPIDDDNRGATGYDSNGQRANQSFRFNLYKNGEANESARARTLPYDREIVVTRHVRGNTLQCELVTVTSEFKIGRIESYFTVYDRARFPAKNSNDNQLSSTNHDINLSRVLFWVSRGSEMYIDRRTRRRVGYLDSKVTGPEPKEKSGAIFQS